MLDKIEIELPRPEGRPEEITCIECHALDSAKFNSKLKYELRLKDLEIDFFFPGWACRNSACQKIIFFEPLGTQVLSRIVGRLVQMGLSEQKIALILDQEWMPKK